MGNDGKWAAASTAAIVGLLLVAFVFGFVVVPIVQGRQAGLDPWTAFCRALGLQPGTPAEQQPVSTATAQPVSQVAWSPEVLSKLVHADRKAGEQVAARICSACHGAKGLSIGPQFPHLSGQSAAAIYKQLHDYKSGARVNPLMAGVVQGLDEDQMADVAAFFSGGNSFGSLGRAQPLSDYEMDRLANTGAPERGIPACNACHGGKVGGPIETPTLAGQRQEYLELQLKAYAKGERHNDVYGRMRSVAGRLSADEIRAMAQYYAGSSPGGGQLR